MILRLVRKEFDLSGIFGELLDERYLFLCSTAEHCYLQEDGSLISKIPDGIYKCVRGDHKLHGMDHPFQTFEIIGIQDHAGILFHQGNYPQKDSDGCVLLGKGIGFQISKEKMLVKSREAFIDFMKLVSIEDEFTLHVESYKN